MSLEARGPDEGASRPRVLADPALLAKRKIRVPARRAAPRKGSPTSWLLLGLLLGGLVAAFVVRSRGQVVLKEPPKILTVRVQKPKVVDLPIRLVYPVELLPLEESHLRPMDVTAHVTKVHVEEGDQVKENQLIVSLDCDEVKAEKRQASEALRRARAAQKLAEITAGRVAVMQKEKFISQQEFDTAQSQAEAAGAHAATAAAKVLQYRKRQSNCELRAPFAGIVTRRYVDEGALIRPGGKPAVTISNASRLRVRMHVVENDVSYIRSGLQADLTIHGLKDQRFTGKVTRFVGALDTATRTMSTEIEIDNARGLLKPGMFGRVSLVVETRKEAVVVPVTGLVVQETGAFAYVFRKLSGEKVPTYFTEYKGDGVAGAVHRVPVTIGHDMGDEVQITEGLKGGDLMVVAGHDLLSEGLVVAAVEGGAEARVGGRVVLPDLLKWRVTKNKVVTHEASPDGGVVVVKDPTVKDPTVKEPKKKGSRLWRRLKGKDKEPPSR